MIPFGEHCARVEEHVERVYGICVVTRDIPDPLTGDLNGAEIHVDPAVSLEQRLFLLAHLFGHTVQWNVDPDAFDLGRLQQPPVKEDQLAVILQYETEAARYALGMLHEIGIAGIDQWLCDYTACDTAYLLHYYRTGEKKDFRSFWRDNTPCLRPLKAPPFRPVMRALRTNGIVI